MVDTLLLERGDEAAAGASAGGMGNPVLPRQCGGPGTSASAPAASAAASSASPTTSPPVVKLRPKAPPKKRAVQSEEDVVVDPECVPAFRADPAGQEVDFLAACGLRGLRRHIRLPAAGSGAAEEVLPAILRDHRPCGH